MRKLGLVLFTCFGLAACATQQQTVGTAAGWRLERWSRVLSARWSAAPQALLSRHRAGIAVSTADPAASTAVGITTEIGSRGFVATARCGEAFVLSAGCGGTA
jgi:hypothetical protein